MTGRVHRRNLALQSRVEAQGLLLRVLLGRTINRARVVDEARVEVDAMARRADTAGDKGRRELLAIVREEVERLAG